MPGPVIDRYVSVRRVLRLWEDIRDREYRPSTPTLARRFRVSRRTIFRDLAVLSELDFRVPPSIGVEP